MQGKLIGKAFLLASENRAQVVVTPSLRLTTCDAEMRASEQCIEHIYTVTTWTKLSYISLVQAASY